MNSGIEDRTDDRISYLQIVLIPFKDLKAKFKFRVCKVFRYMQLKNWIKEHCDIKNVIPANIKTILKQDKKGKKCISALYRSLIMGKSNNGLLKNIYEGWDKDLKVVMLE